MTREFDVHGYHPYQVPDFVQTIVQQAWEMGADYLRLIHGHGFNRERCGAFFVHSNTGWLGQTVRSALRNTTELRQWIYYSTLDCSDIGATTVRIKPNPDPTRKEGVFDELPKKEFEN
jgi:Smr domain